MSDASLRTPFLLFASALALSGCAAEPSVPFTPREPGVRAPLTADCDALDETRCLLPWPSSTFLELDPSTETGVRVRVSVESINDDDDASLLSQADGFSRVTPVMAGFPVALDASTLGGPREGAIRLFVASPDHPRYGEEEPLRIEVVIDARTSGTTTLLTGDPLTVLEPATDYVAVVTDALRSADGAPLPVSRATQLAIGTASPRTEEEALIAGYHAPTRTLLSDVGIDPRHVLRAWDFTTRSIANATTPVEQMRDLAVAAVEGDEVDVRIDLVEHRESGPVATIVEGHLTNLPIWIEDGFFTFARTDENGVPEVVGRGDAPFRITIPRGEGDYRAVMFGHGAGGTYHDNGFDEVLGERGIAKLGIQFYGWDETNLIDTLLTLLDIIRGVERGFSPLMQAVAHAIAIERAMGGIIADVLAAEELGGMPNPHAGRRLDWSTPTWVGGSLGGTAGLVVCAVDPAIEIGVLNVPGASWGQWVTSSYVVRPFESAISRTHNGPVNMAIVAAMAQGLFDYADGASWVETIRASDDVYLLQESIGDEVVLNDGTDAVGIVTSASMVGAVLDPIEGLPEVDGTRLEGRTGLTQFIVPQGDIADVHGFAARESTPAGMAAYAQIERFLESAWDGTPIIEVPEGCEAARCDFQ